MPNQLQELKLMLSAIREARAAWQAHVQLKFNEACLLEKPQSDSEFKALYARVSTSSDAQIEYQKLVNLYGCIGAQSTDYLTALEKVA